MEMPVEDENNRKQTLIFSYDTLKRGFANHGLMEDLISANNAAYVGAYRTVHELSLVCGPHGVPFLLNLLGLGRHRIHDELYAVSDAGLARIARIDELEGITLGHYERLPIRLVADEGNSENRVVVVEAEAYYAHQSFAEEMWKRNGRVRFGVYTEKETKDYVRREARRKGRSFLQDIQLFVSSSSS